jgi:hypothetical protein
MSPAKKQALKLETKDSDNLVHVTYRKLTSGLEKIAIGEN